mgnify:FL=1
MLYPRITTINNKEVFVDDSQMVGYREHMTQEYRTLFLSGVLTGETDSHNLLMALDTLSHDPIKLVITSPGGDLDSTFLFYDTMKMIKSPIITIGRYCASAAALLLAAGNQRYLFPHAKVMLHRPWGKQEGDSRDLEIQGQEMKKYQTKFLEALIECGVKKTHDEILEDIDRNLWLEPDQAIKYGLADKVMTPEIWNSWIKEDTK